MAAPTVVLDSSAVLAMFKAEPGWDRVVAVLPRAVLSTVNAAEVYSKLVEWKLTREEQMKFQAMLVNLVVPYDNDLALRTGALRASTQEFGLSFADRACLALAQRLGVRVMTADKIWAKVKTGVEIDVIR